MVDVPVIGTVPGTGNVSPTVTMPAALAGDNVGIPLLRKAQAATDVARLDQLSGGGAAAAGNSYDNLRYNFKLQTDFLGVIGASSTGALVTNNEAQCPGLVIQASGNGTNTSQGSPAQGVLYQELGVGAGAYSGCFGKALFSGAMAAATDTVFEFNLSVNISDVADTSQIFMAGLRQTTDITDSNGVWFEYDRSVSANWRVGYGKTAGTRTYIDTGYAAVSGAQIALHMAGLTDGSVEVTIHRLSQVYSGIVPASGITTNTVYFPVAQFQRKTSVSAKTYAQLYYFDYRLKYLTATNPRLG